jgi:vacuolar-type H+-ATPase subunit I/STV1
LARLEQQAEFIKAQRGGIASDRLFAVQGWLPAEQAATLSAALDRRIGIPAATHCDGSRPKTSSRPR